MRFIKSFGNTFFIYPKRCFKQLFGGIQNAHNLRPAADTHCIFELSCNFPVRDKGFFFLLVIAKIAKMDQQCQHVVAGLKRSHIVLKA